MRRIFIAGTLCASIAGRQGSSQAQAPGLRAGAAMVYDSTHAQTILFGGWTRATAGGAIFYPNDVWAWDGDRWRKLEPLAGTPQPPGRDAAVLGSDSRRGRLVMFGGRGDGTNLPSTWTSDVWEWDGKRWFRIPTSDLPHLLHPAVAYDPARAHVLIFGGGVVSGAGAFAGLSRTLWEWDGRHWAARDTAGPANQTPGALSVGVDGAVMLFGGALGVNRSSPAVPSRTWILRGGAWTDTGDAPAFNNLQATTSAPDGTLYFYHAWEDWLTSPVLYVRAPNDTWRRVQTAHTPGVRNTQAMAWDARRHRLVLFGGTLKNGELLGDTWEFDGTDWVQRAP